MPNHQGSGWRPLVRDNLRATRTRAATRSEARVGQGFSVSHPGNRPLSQQAGFGTGRVALQTRDSPEVARTSRGRTVADKPDGSQLRLWLIEPSRDCASSAGASTPSVEPESIGSAEAYSKARRRGETGGCTIKADRRRRADSGFGAYGAAWAAAVRVSFSRGGLRARIRGSSG
jgi:hypothetical protein